MKSKTPAEPDLSPKDQWDARYRAADTTVPPEPARVLADHDYLLPPAGTALDLASGLGGNALHLARCGLDAHAWDISGEALAKLEGFARDLGLAVRTEARDVAGDPPAPESFDVIVVSRFLDRALAPALSAALKPGGLLFYQTFTRERVTPAGPRNPAFLLEPNELLALFRGLRVVVYREEGTIGDGSRGVRNEALFIGRKEEPGRPGSDG
jgi:tellurite methyltransferase